MNTLVEKMLTKSQVWIYSVCCLRTFASLIWCTSTWQLQGPLCSLDSGVAFYFQIFLSLLCTYKHHPLPFLLLLSRVYLLCLLWDVGLCSGRCTWGSFHLVMKSEGTGVDLVQAGSRQTGWESMPLDFLGVVCAAFTWQSRRSHMSARAGCLCEIQPAGWGWMVEPSAVIQWGLMQAPPPFALHCGLVT